MAQWQQQDPRRQQPATPPQWQQSQPQQPVYQPQYLPAQQQPYQPPLYGAQQQWLQVAPKSPAAGLVVSIFLPGVGSMMAGKTGKGIGILVGWLIGWLLCLVLIGFLVMPAFWIWGLVAGYQDAVWWNRAHGIVS